MATLDLIGQLMNGSAGNPPLGATIVFLLLSVAGLESHGTSGDADRADRGSGRSVAEGGRGRGGSDPHHHPPTGHGRGLKQKVPTMHSTRTLHIDTDHIDTREQR